MDIMEIQIKMAPPIIILKKKILYFIWFGKDEEIFEYLELSGYATFAIQIDA